MTKYTRLTGKVFGSSATATGDNPEIGQFGSALAGTYNGTTDVSTIQSLPAWQKGFIGAVTPNTQFPPLPEVTGFGKVLSHQICYLLQQGVPEYDNGTTYYDGNWCSYQKKLYFCKNDNDGAGISGFLPTNITYWSQFTGGSSRELGEIVTSSLPITNPIYHLADGSQLSSVDYPELLEYISEIYPTYISSDWAQAYQSPQLATQTSWQSITYGNGIYLARGKLTTQYLSTSTDGINWATPYEIDPDNIGLSFKWTQYVAYGNDVFVAVGSSDSYVSTDAVNWQVASTSAGGVKITNVIFDGEKFVVIDTRLGNVYTSTDGTSWQVIGTYGGFVDSTCLAFDGNKYVINGLNGMMITSTDLINWTSTQPTGITGQFTYSMYMGYDGSRFFGIYNGQVSYSIDGINWTTPVTDSNLGNRVWVSSTNNPSNMALLSSDGYVSTKGAPSGVFTTEGQWQQTYTTYGECGKYVYNPQANTLRLPLYNSYLTNTTNPNNLGDLTPASIPNVKGIFSGVGQAYGATPMPAILTDAFYRYNTTNDPSGGIYIANSGSGVQRDDIFGLDASRVSSVYSNTATTVNTQSIKQLVYIVVAK